MTAYTYDTLAPVLMLEAVRQVREPVTIMYEGKVVREVQVNDRGGAAIVFDQSENMPPKQLGDVQALDCIAAEQAMNAYVAQWTNYCQHCQGAGVLTWQENQAPLGSGHTWLETLSEPCDNCVGAGRCPRCGGAAPASWDDGGEEPCPNCGWNWCKVAGDCKPDAECYCHEWTDEGEFRDAKAQWYADQPN